MAEVKRWPLKILLVDEIVFVNPYPGDEILGDWEFVPSGEAGKGG